MCCAFMVLFKMLLKCLLYSTIIKSTVYLLSLYPNLTVKLPTAINAHSYTQYWRVYIFQLSVFLQTKPAHVALSSLMC